jgi:hypothetical protein
MTTSTLSTKSLLILDQYVHFRFGSAVCSVPYFNNRTVGARAALRATIGKGSPKDIQEELQSITVKNHIDYDSLADESLKKLLVDNNLGIECSGFAYYVLNAESEERGKGTLDKHLRFVKAGGFLGKIRAKLRPVENCDVATFADDANSSMIPINEVRPGDFISMQNDGDESERDHILVVTEIDYDNPGMIPGQNSTGNSRPTKIYYSHAVAYPEDGKYGTGIKQGLIELSAECKTLADGLWSENGTTANATRIFNRAKKSRTEIRRLKWF